MAPINPILYKYLLMKRMVSGTKNLDLIFIESQFLENEEFGDIKII
jgi:hypothetical protein